MPIEPRTIEGKLSSAVRVAVVVSRYSHEVTDRLLEGAVGEFNRRVAESLSEKDARKCQLDVFPAAGSFEIPALVAALAESEHYDAIVALGCIVKGETKHDEYLSHAVTGELARISVDLRIPVGLGVLTTDTWEQSLARAGGEMGNKGAEAMTAAMESLIVMWEIEEL
ncbi:MAG TPA: 6,7-dimethyl-8-ribityllumazine synthase [Phycisphaerales bacterium]|nr:6,7-dimethyl-8-ribityllumazine synthase [Phycisphaerales bacterium]